MTCDLSRAEDQRLNQESFLQIFLQVFLKLDLLQFCMWESDWWHCTAFHCIFQIKMFIIKQLAKAVILGVTEKFCSLLPANFWCGENKKSPFLWMMGNRIRLYWSECSKKVMPTFLSLCLFWKQQLIFATGPELLPVALATGCTGNKIPLQAKSLRGKFPLWYL